jgi:hypothetical protein
MINSASVSKDGLAVILRDAAKTPLLRMRSEIYSQALRMRAWLKPYKCAR